jgi:hypothetical protein
MNQLNFIKLKIFWIINSYLFTFRKRLMREVGAYCIVSLSRESERLFLTNDSSKCFVLKVMIAKQAM